MEHVVTHGAWQVSRGRQPSEPYGEIKNPREAYGKALSDLALSGETAASLSEAVARMPMFGSLERRIVMQNLEYHVARRAYAAALANRAETIFIAHEQGRTYASIGAIIDRTPGRIQQIVTAARD